LTRFGRIDERSPVVLGVARVVLLFRRVFGWIGLDRSGFRLDDLSLLDLLINLGRWRRRSLRLGLNARLDDGDAGCIDEVERLIRVIDAHCYVRIDGSSESGGRASTQHRSRVRLPV